MPFCSQNKKKRVDLSKLDTRIKPKEYSVNRDGTVYSFKRKRNLTPFLRNQYIAFRAGGHTLSLHRVLAKAFIKNPAPEKYNVVDHIDENKLNNDLDNLCWCTASENISKSAVWKKNFGKKYEPLTRSQKKILIDLQDKYPETKNHEDLNKLMNL
jgi:hypothetical protein